MGGAGEPPKTHPQRTLQKYILKTSLTVLIFVL
jgi:hypothetical protein